MGNEVSGYINALRTKMDDDRWVLNSGSVIGRFQGGGGGRTTCFQNCVLFLDDYCCLINLIWRELIVVRFEDISFGSNNF